MSRQRDDPEKRRTSMARCVVRLRLIVGVLAVAFIVAFAAPVSAQQPTSVDPDARAVTEQQLLQNQSKIQGRGTIPDTKSDVIEHPAGRDWRHFHQVTLPWIGGIAVLGMVALLTGF